MRNLKLHEEPAALREEYCGEFGQRCLLARRLNQSGVRFVEVSHNLNFINGTGWDTHFEGQLNQHVLIQELDIALAALIRDLEKKGLLDKTLIATGIEFGRPAEFDNRGKKGSSDGSVRRMSLVYGTGHEWHCLRCFRVLLVSDGRLPRSTESRVPSRFEVSTDCHR